MIVILLSRRTLDYIFVTDEWTVQDAEIYPKVIVPKTGGDDEKPCVEEDGRNGSVLQGVTVCTSQPSRLWPSDHFMIVATLTLE